jgi:DNA-directed RNA polymerase subunit beta'
LAEENKNLFDAMKIGLASPEKIRSWSRGEVKKAETINYRTLKPEKEGLFCEKIFGPQKDWECSCGKFKKIRYKGVVCDRCGVEVTKAKVRRERMGHIELAAPISHIWFFKGIPSRMGLALDMSPKALEEVIYFNKYVVINPGQTTLPAKYLLSDVEYRQNIERWGYSFEAGMGAEAIQKLLQNLDLDAEIQAIREEMDQIRAKQSGENQRNNRLIKRLEVLEAFRNSDNEPDWMILEVLPVIPPELRPMVQLEGGRFATSDLNDLYRRVINRNNRLKKLLDLGAPDIIVQNEKRMLQEAVDALIDNGRRGRPVTGPGNRELKSLSHMLKGKQGRFRQNLLGKRVDYSGRSVIVVGPNLKMYQCGLPKEMALELFKPFVMKELVNRALASNIKNAKKKVDRVSPEVWDVLEDVIKEHPVLLNRAPTLHRLGIQAFEPILVEGRAIKLHPLVCTAYNADFDGDQMAVHVPLSAEAQAEARILMLASGNILNPKDGKPVVTPSQDMVLGSYYLTMDNPSSKGSGMVFATVNEAVTAYEQFIVNLHARVAIPVSALKKDTFSEKQQNALLITTVGKIIFNEIYPADLPYINEANKDNLTIGLPDKHFIFDKGANVRERILQGESLKAIGKDFLGVIISECFRRFQTTRSSVILDKIKELGFTYSTKAGITIAVSDVVVPKEKETVINEAQEKITKIQGYFNRGLLTEDERYKKTIDVWQVAKDDLSDILMNTLERDNSIKMMQDSKARGNKSQITQLAGMRGCMSNPSGKIIELPIKSNFREGLSVLEYFISTHGARKGLADTALRTADSGYLTRRLVDVAQDVIVREEDCGTDKGFWVRRMGEGKEIIQNISDRLEGRNLAQSFRFQVPATDRFAKVRLIIENEFKNKWNAETGVLVFEKDYFIDEHAADLIGKIDDLLRKMYSEAVETVDQLRKQVAEREDLEKELADSKKKQSSEIQAKIDQVQEGIEQLKISLQELSRDKTPVMETKEDIYSIYLDELDFKISIYLRSVLSCRSRNGGICKQCYGRNLATGKFVEIGEAVGIIAAQSIGEPGTQLTMRTFHTGGVAGVDITQGLPRIQELFEARNPKGQAVVSEIRGIVTEIRNEKDHREIVIVGEHETKVYPVPFGSKIKVVAHDDNKGMRGHLVKSGEPLTEGSLNPKEILQLKVYDDEKPLEIVQNYILQEVQRVYRLQGVEINDKHIEVMIRQMLRKIKVINAGDTSLLEGTTVDLQVFEKANEDAFRVGKIPAIGKQILLGITKASLETDSYLSAASFQETTRVLTDAAIKGKVDKLLGLKENVIIGKLIPAGTGMMRYNGVEIEHENAQKSADDTLNLDTVEEANQA